MYVMNFMCVMYVIYVCNLCMSAWYVCMCVWNVCTYACVQFMHCMCFVCVWWSVRMYGICVCVYVCHGCNVCMLGMCVLLSTLGYVYNVLCVCVLRMYVCVYVF